jgi:soluble lytic murein transglycosylase-like protein
LLKKTVNDASSFDDKFDAEVWLVDMSRRLERYVPDPQQRLEWLKQIHYEAARAELIPELVLSVIYIESRFNRYAVSSAGAQGLMQVMPFWKNEIGRPEDNLTKVSTNLRYGCTILKHYIDKEKGNLTRALARYNGSLGKTWYPEKVLNAWEKYWFVKQE